MRLFIIGSKWMGGWTEGVERAARSFGWTTRVFYYETPYSPSISLLKTKVNWLVPPSLRNFFLPPADRIGYVWEKHMNQLMTKIGKSFQPDIIMVLKGTTLKAKALEALRVRGRRIISWWLDDPIRYISENPEIQGQFEHFDALFVFDRGYLDELKKLGAQHPTYLPCAFDPSLYHPKRFSLADLNRYKCDLGFIASYYPERGELLRQMQGLDVAVWGYGWNKALEIKSFPPGTLRGKKLAGPQVATAYNIMPICLNLHHPQTSIGGLNMRAFEIPAAGGFQLMDAIPGAEELFEPGTEIVMARSPIHFRELAEYYLAHPSERHSIARRGYERTIRDHTYAQRMRVVFQTVGRLN